MRVRFLDRFDFVTHRSASGTPRATVAYAAGDEPVTVPRAHGEAAVAAGKAIETPDEPAVRTEIVKQVRGRARGGVIKPGSYIVGERGGETVTPK